MKHEISKTHSIEMEKDDVAYIAFEKFEDRKVFKTVELKEIVKDYKGPDVMLDFSEDHVLMGIEILA